MSASEAVDLVDENDRVVGRASREQVRRERLRHRSVYILLFNRKGQIFLHQRTQTKDVYPGYWDVTVGGVVSAGEDYEACAARELAEEVGLTHTSLRKRFAFRFEDQYNRINGMVFECIADRPLRLQPEEILQGRWVDLDEVEQWSARERFCPDGLAVLAQYRSLSVPSLEPTDTSSARPPHL